MRTSFKYVPLSPRSSPPPPSVNPWFSRNGVLEIFYLLLLLLGGECVCMRAGEREGRVGGWNYVYSRALGQSRILVCTGERTPVCPWGELEFQFTLRNSSSYGDSSLSFCKLEFQFILGRSEILLDFSLYCYMYRERERGQWSMCVLFCVVSGDHLRCWIKRHVNWAVRITADQAEQKGEQLWALPSVKVLFKES